MFYALCWPQKSPSSYPPHRGEQLLGFCWDENDQTRAWSKRFFAALHRMPTMSQAGFYSAIHHYLEAVKALSRKDPDKVM
jgi:hypothetical protein